jgi:hypothetical protein
MRTWLLLLVVCFACGCRQDQPTASSKGDDPTTTGPPTEVRKRLEAQFGDVWGDSPKGDRLAKPVPVKVDGKPLVREGGSLIPFVGDIDGDGRPDLLLGTREDGRLLVYRNVGTIGSPRLSGPLWFDDMVPTGRIPRG